MGVFKKLFTSSFEWDLDEDLTEEGQAASRKSLYEGVTLHTTIDGEPAIVIKGKVYKRGVKYRDGFTVTIDMIDQYLDR